jgi:hypothetical protein
VWGGGGVMVEREEQIQKKSRIGRMKMQFKAKNKSLKTPCKVKV